MNGRRPQRSNPLNGDARFRRNTAVAIPFMLAVPVLYGFAFGFSGWPILWAIVGVGAAGWLLALALRGPVAAIAMRGGADQGRTWIVAASGPVEESVRLGALALTSSAFVPALSLGLGWASIEVLYTVIAALAMANLARRTDEQSRQAQEVLAAQGMMRDVGPALGVLERISATALHIGFTLLVAWDPLLVLVTIPLHSAINLSLTLAFRRHPLVSEALIAVAAGIVLAVGLALFGHL